MAVGLELTHESLGPGGGVENFASALAAMVLVYAVAQFLHGLTPLRLVLTGTALAYAPNPANAPIRITALAPTAVPDEMPSTNGSASALRTHGLHRHPTAARPPPTTAASTTRGSRISQTMVYAKTHAAQQGDHEQHTDPNSQWHNGYSAHGSQAARREPCVPFSQSAASSRSGRVPPRG